MTPRNADELPSRLPHPGLLLCSSGATDPVAAWRREQQPETAASFGCEIVIGHNGPLPSAGQSDDMSETDVFDDGAHGGYRALAGEAQLQAWIAAVAGQDQQALAKLYEAMAGRVYGLALRITRQVQSAEEVAEDVFWQVWRQAPRFDATRGSAVAWILTIARSRALDALRRRDRAEPLEDERLAALADDADPQDLLAAVQRQHRLHAALRSLDPLPRQLLALAFFRGLPHEEIAAQMSLPLGTVKSHIRRALLRLRQLLGADDSPSPMVTR